MNEKSAGANILINAMQILIIIIKVRKKILFIDASKVP